MAVVSLHCPNCSAPLEIGPSLDRFACLYCGANLVASRSGGTLALTQLHDTALRIAQGTDRVASELALVRIKPEYVDAHVCLNDAIARHSSANEARDWCRRRWYESHQCYWEQHTKRDLLFARNSLIAVAIAGYFVFGLWFVLLSISCSVAAHYYSLRPPNKKPTPAEIESWRPIPIPDFADERARVKFLEDEIKRHEAIVNGR